MSDYSGIKILQDKLAKLTSDNKKKDVMITDIAYKVNKLVQQNKEKDLQINELVQQNKEKDLQINELVQQINDLKKHLAYYENSNSPPSAKSHTYLKRQKIRREHHDADKKEKTPPGAKKGHIGVSHHNRSTKTIHHKVDKCTKCGNTDLIETNQSSKQIIDVITKPIVEITTLVSINTRCNCCNLNFTPDTHLTPGTSAGPNIQAIALELYDVNVSTANISRILKDVFGVYLSKATVQNMLHATRTILEPVADKIKEDFINDDAPRYQDETGMPINGKRGHTWVTCNDSAAYFLVAASRAAAVPETHFPWFDAPIVCDGYAGYNSYNIRQRCWSHILRDAESIYVNCKDDDDDDV